MYGGTGFSVRDRRRTVKDVKEPVRVGKGTKCVDMFTRPRERTLYQTTMCKCRRTSSP